MVFDSLLQEDSMDCIMLPYSKAATTKGGDSLLNLLNYMQYVESRKQVYG